MRAHGLSLVALIFICASSVAQSNPHPAESVVLPAKVRMKQPKVCPPCVHAYEDFLAADTLNGRGSTTHDELVAATYLASKLEEFGVTPAGDNGGYLQKVPLIRRKLSIPPQLRFSDPAKNEEINWKHGLEMLLLHSGPEEVSGPLQKLALGEVAPVVHKGAFVLLLAKPGAPVPTRKQAMQIWQQGAGAVLIPENPGY